MLVLFSLVAVAAGMLVLVGGSAAGQDAATPGDCKAKQYRLLFWPEGHPAIPSIGFPEFLTPHLEVYKGTGNKYADADLVGAEDPTSAQVSTEKCKAAAETGTAKEPAKKKSTQDAAKITCKLKVSPVLEGSAIPGGIGAVLAMTIKDQRVAVVTMFANQPSEVFYNSKLCKLSPAPS